MRIACVLSDGVEDSELTQPMEAFRKAGHEVVIIGAEKREEIAGKHGEAKVRADMGIDEARPEDFDALFVPGGYSPDHLRVDARFLHFARAFADADRPIVAVCHGPQLLSSADAIRGRRLTAWPTVQEDLRRMGERVEDAEVVVDGQLVTSRKPGDLEAFCRESLKLFGRVPAGR
jgi:protease I